MNIFAEQMQLTSTFFDSPHGLMNIQNYSCAYDMCKLSCQAMKLDVFRQIVGTKSYKCSGWSTTKNIDDVESPATRTRKLKQREPQNDFFKPDYSPNEFQNKEYKHD